MQLNIRTPQTYISEPGILSRAGEIIKKHGDRAFFIAGEHAWEAAGKSLQESLQAHDIISHTELFTGFPTAQAAQNYATKAQDWQADMIVAVGGGKTMDVAKAAGNLADITVITIPTIAATCAAWAALSVLYTEEGDFCEFRRNAHCPKLILADTEVIARAPARYLKAGIVDTLAKWYETAPALQNAEEDLPLNISVYGAKLGFDLLEREAPEAIRAAEKGEATPGLQKTVDAILYLAGFVGSFIGGKAYGGFAHPFYHSVRRVRTAEHMLHGELVAFGIITQVILEKRPDAETEEIIRQFNRLDEAFTLEEIGFTDEQEQYLVADRILREFPGIVIAEEYQNREDIVRGFREADQKIRQITGKGGR